MKLPSGLFTLTIKEKEVFYFSTDKIDSPEPHFFICIKKNENEVLLFTCCTTRGSKREKYVQLKGYSLTTIVYIKPGDSGNQFKEDTYVDCNKCIQITKAEFEKMCNDGRMQFKGEISAVYYEQILIGLHSSPEIEKELKAQLPNPDNLE